MIIRILPEVTVLFLILFARIGALVMLMPGLGEQSVSARVRLALALLLTMVFYPTLAGKLPSGLANDTNRLIFALVTEVLIGVALGLTARLLLSIAQIAGTAIASDIGLGFAQSVDPTMGQQGAIISSFLSVTGITVIFMSDLHHVAIAGISGSYAMFPPGEAVPVADFKDVVVLTIAEAFKTAIQIAAPFMVFALVYNLGLGVLQKLMPQFQVYFLAMPLTIVIGLAIFASLMVSIFGLYRSFIETGLMRLVPG